MSFKSNIQFLNYDVKKITCWEGPICVFVSNPKFKDKYLNMSKNKRNQKKLILLANQDKAYVKYTNTLLKHFYIKINR